MKVLCCQKLNSKVKCWITNFSPNFLFSFFSTLSQQRIFCHCQNREKIYGKLAGRSLSLPKRWQRRPIFWGQPSEQVWRQGLWGLQGNLSIKFSEANKGDIRERHVAVITSLSPKPEVTCAFFPFDACNMKSNNSGGQQSAILQVHWADRGILAWESGVGQWNRITSDYLPFFVIKLLFFCFI